MKGGAYRSGFYYFAKRTNMWGPHVSDTTLKTSLKYKTDWLIYSGPHVSDSLYLITWIITNLIY